MLKVAALAPPILCRVLITVVASYFYAKTA